MKCTPWATHASAAAPEVACKLRRDPHNIGATNYLRYAVRGICAVTSLTRRLRWRRRQAKKQARVQARKRLASRQQKEKRRSEVGAADSQDQEKIRQGGEDNSSTQGNRQARTVTRRGRRQEKGRARAMPLTASPPPPPGARFPSFHAVIDTVRETDELRNKMGAPGVSESE